MGMRVERDDFRPVAPLDEPSLNALQNPSGQTRASFDFNTFKNQTQDRYKFLLAGRPAPNAETLIAGTAIGLINRF